MSAVTLKRRDDWRARMHAAMDEIRRRPFEWGAHDCGPSFAGRLVEAITGTDLAGPWRGRYSSRTGALQVMRNDGFDDLADLVASVLPEHEHVSRARVGDLAAVPMDTAFKSAIGVVGGERVFVLHPSGLATVNLSRCTRAFMVG